MTDATAGAQGVEGIVAWLVDGARTVHRPGDVLDELCRRLAAAGVPLAEAIVFVRTPHPRVTGRRFRWRAGEPLEVVEVGAEDLDTSTLPAPLREAMRSRTAVADGRRGIAFPLPFTSGEVHAVGWRSDPRGFTDDHRAALASVRIPLARLAEVYALKRTAVNLLDTYVGRNAGERILDGRIHRGEIEVIDAALFLTDLRGFTALSDRLEPRALVDLLNGYFDRVGAAIETREGEVLKFLGDGLLAIFPTAPGRDRACVCRAALEAARRALSSPGPEEDPGLRFGVALDVGEVLFGNVGSRDRLDFTVIGPAVNRTARLERLGAERSWGIVTSSSFAGLCGAKLRSVGRFRLRGFAAAEEVFVHGGEAMGS